MKGEKNNIKYSAEDIRKYLDGLLSDPEMQALEKAALNDPFLADAIEGMEESRNHPVSFESGLAELQKTLAQRVRQKNRKSGLILLFSKWQIAASVLFILVVAALTLTYINNKNRRIEIAKSIKKDSGTEKAGSLPLKKETDTTGAVAIRSLPQNPLADSAVMAFNGSASTEKKSRQKKILSLNRDTFNKKPEELPTVNLSKTSSVANAEPAEATSIAKNADRISASPEPVEKQLNGKVSGLEISKFKNLLENYIKGVVTDDKGKPIPFAAVSIEGLKKGTTTDTHGFFKLYLKNADTTRKVEINTVGYETISVKLKPDSSFTNRIQMQAASTALNEVVVNGYSIKKRRNNSSSFSKTEGNQNAEKAIGCEKFFNYVNTNKKILTADSLLKGDEIISFVVNKKSELSSFKIEKSISQSHDAVIIRLIKAGPALKILKGRKQRLRITISFK